MNISEELRNLANRIEGTSLNTIEEINIKQQLYEEFILRLELIEEHLERKRAQPKNLDLKFSELFINDYKDKLNKIKNADTN